MALDRNNVLSLMKALTDAAPNAPVAYSYEGQDLSYSALNTTLRNEFQELAGSKNLWRENKHTVFAIMEQYIDDVLPKKVSARYADLADVQVFPQGTKAQFRRKMNNRYRAKQFITRVGLAGRYEVFKLGASEEVFEVPTSAIGSAVQIGFEEFLDGRVDFAELLEIVLEGLDELIYFEVAEAMKAAINQLPLANRIAAPGFDEAAFDKLITIASAYGTPVIYCTNEFAVKMLPQDAWRYTEAMKTELWANGRLATYKGNKVVILEQGFEDETNSKKVIDPGYVWIIPTGANGRPVKVAIEGDTHMREVENEDWSREIQMYKKVGVVAMLTNDICSYVDTELLGQFDTWNTLDTVKNTVVVIAE